MVSIGEVRHDNKNNYIYQGDISNGVTLCKKVCHTKSEKVIKL